MLRHFSSGSVPLGATNTGRHRAPKEAASAVHRHWLGASGVGTGTRLESERSGGKDGGGAAGDGGNGNEVGDEGEDKGEDGAGFGWPSCTTEPGGGGAWGELRGSLVPFLLRRLVRRRWDATYGPQSPSALAAAAGARGAARSAAVARGRGGGGGEGNGDGAGESEDAGEELGESEVPGCPRLPAPYRGLYGQWVDGKGCGETWAHGCPRGLASDPRLFQVACGRAVPDAGEFNVPLHPTARDRHLTDKV